MHYLNYFLSLKCAGDVLNAVNPVNNVCKEITEAMAICQKLKRVCIKEPMKYSLIDLCAGNGLVGVLAAHLLPLEHVTCIDERSVNRNWHLVNRFSYLTADITDDYIYRLIGNNTIIASSHPCGKLAERVLELYNNSPATHLVMIPCCTYTPRITGLNNILIQKLNSYELWAYWLSEQAKGEVKTYKDNKCLSPRNIVITASKV